MRVRAQRAPVSDGIPHSGPILTKDGLDGSSGAELVRHPLLVQRAGGGRLSELVGSIPTRSTLWAGIGGLSLNDNPPPLTLAYSLDAGEPKYLASRSYFIKC
jgi:hypothetical protein